MRALAVLLVAALPSAARADFTGFYAGVNGGIARLADPDRPGHAAVGSAAAGSGRAAPAADRLSPLPRREDLPASMTRNPRSLDGR